MSKRDFLSVAIIVKNGEKTIENTLSNLHSITNQIVVIDTGSTDNTIKICKKYNCEIIFQKWQDDFSLHRNYALAHCRNPWILSIDSDEVLDIDTFSQFYEVANENKFGGVNLQIENHLIQQQVSTIHRYTRIFRNNPTIRYKGIIHEQIIESIEDNGYQIYQSNIKINHYGYHSMDEEKSNRNRDLLMKQLEANNEDSINYYHLGETEFAVLSFAKSKEYFSKALEYNDLDEHRVNLAKIRLAQIALKNDEINLIPELLNFTNNDLNLEGFRMYVMAAYYVQIRNFHKALELYKNDLTQKSTMVNINNIKEICNKLEAYL